MIGDAVGFIGSPFDAVVSSVVRWRQGLGQTVTLRTVPSLDDAVMSLVPCVHPWKREAFADGGSWTAYINEGSDPVPVTGHISAQLHAQAVVATCAVNPPHASTQFELLGPTGEPPLLYVRTVSAHCEDGRWRWYEHGEVQPFEQVERYQVRRVRDRLNRGLLIEYLSALGIEADDPHRFGRTTIVTQE